MPAQSFTSLLSKANPAPALNTLGRRIKSVVTAHVFKPKKSVGAYADTLITSEEKPPTHAAPPSSATLPQTPVNLSPLTLSKRSIKAAMASHTSFRSDNQTLPSPTSTAIYTAPLYEEPTRESLICLCTVETRSVQVPYNPVTDGPCQELPAPVSAPTDTCPSTPIFGFNPAPTPIPEACPIYKMVSTTYIVDTDDVPLFFLTLLCPTRYNGSNGTMSSICQRLYTFAQEERLVNSDQLPAIIREDQSIDYQAVGQPKPDQAAPLHIDQQLQPRRPVTKAPFIPRQCTPSTSLCLSAATGKIVCYCQYSDGGLMISNAQL